MKSSENLQIYEKTTPLFLRGSSGKTGIAGENRFPFT